jgi:hypothetical protein
MKLLGIRKLGCTVAAASLLAASGGALAQGVKNSINLVVGGVPPIGYVNATVVMLEYERLITQKISVFGRGSSLKYKYDDDEYEEEGDGRGIGLGVRFFPQGGLRGFYVGGAVSTFKSTWDWIDDKGTSFTSRGDGESTSIQWGAEVGYRFNLGTERISLTPAVHVGSWLGGDTKCNTTSGPGAGTSCDKESQLGFYGAVSVALGIAF